VKTYPLRSKRDWRKEKDIDLCIVNGEGTTHHGNGISMVGWAVDNYPRTILVNAVWQDNPVHSWFKKLEYVSMRESMSADQFPGECDVIPDIAFASSTLMNYKREGVSQGVGLGDSVVGNSRKKICAIQRPLEYLDEIGQYDRLVLGRHHGVMAAASIGIPWSAYPSNTHKIQGMMRDMGVEDRYYQTMEEAQQNIPDKLPQSVEEYVKSGRKKITELFDSL